MGSYGSIGDGLATAFNGMIVALALSVPLAIWKLIDILVWFYNHVSVSVK